MLVYIDTMRELLHGLCCGGRGSVFRRGKVTMKIWGGAKIDGVLWDSFLSFVISI